MAAVVVGVWVQAAAPVADHLFAGEDQAQDRADSGKPPFEQTDPVHDWEGNGKGGEHEKWALDRVLTADEITMLRRFGSLGPSGESGPAHSARLGAWARSVGARPILSTGDVGEVVVKFQLLGTRTKPVVIHRLRAEVMESSCRRSRVRTIIGHVSQGGGEAAQVYFDLDDPKPVASLIGAPTESEEEYDDKRFESLSAGGQPSGFVVSATSRRTCAWQIEADWQDSFGKGTAIIDDSGKPFTLEAPGPDVEHFAEWDGDFVPLDEWAK
ncbi:hypothetical protein [Streptomyces sp. NPDC020965]|uniref:hypothetical protein n=1 Tax=Streptomyces sp. NPDC020965 TaxID=3365105 RepID=UPI0037BCF768